MGGRRWHLPKGGQRRSGRPPRQVFLQNGGSGPELVEQVLVETAPASTRRSCHGYAEHPDGLPGPQLAVALQPPVGQMHRLLVVGQDGAWQDPEGRLGVGPAGAEIAQDFW